MLNNIRLHTYRNNLYFNLVDVGKLLNRRPDSLCRAKYVTVKSFTISSLRPANYTNEASFKILFKSNKRMLEELEQYKATGAMGTTKQNAYSNLLTVAYFYACADSSSLNLELNGVPALPKAVIAKYVHKKEVALALLQVYLNALFSDQAATPPDLVLRYEVFKAFPNQVDTQMLSSIFYGGPIPDKFVKALRQATCLDTAPLRKALLLKLNIDQVAIAAKTCITAAKTDMHSVYGLPNTQGNDKPKLASYHFLYPKTSEFIPLDTINETTWLGE